MKTYEEFRLEIMEQDFETPISHAKIEELAAKEYAKQWVLQTSEELNYILPAGRLVCNQS